MVISSSMPTTAVAAGAHDRLVAAEIEPALAALRAFPAIAAEPPDADGLQWALAEPRSKEGQLQNIRIGFKGDQLAVLDILDGFGQRTVMRFGALELNPSLPASRFAFTPPKGADVVRP